ncbi:nucleolin 2 isoform X3 [Raphanus sativus]|uniref:Nucleolin 2 isoform X3 n=2 Tax=Raphanus sativus TaxID=3726 RepID=A0A6J0KEK1_RAPSA|nr:nucleolin 2 isoform X3 [Raphanus sativus]
MSPTEGCATKGMSLLTLNERETTTKRSKPRKRDIGRIRVKGFSIDLPRDDVESALRKHFSSCGEITDVCVHVLTDNLLSDRGFIYFLGGQGTVDKAMQLSGTDVGGWNVIVEPYPFLENADWDPVAFVQGYDTGLGKTEIKRMLFNHFSSCGQIMDIEFHNSTIGVASVYLYGEGAEDKVLDLDGSYMGGCKILVKHIITNGIYTVHPRRRHYGWPRIRNFADKHENLSQVMIPATPNMVLIVICFSVCSL